MKTNWEVKKLGEVCIVERGSSPRPIKEYITNDTDGLNWIKIGDTKNVEKYIYSTNQKITREGANKSRFVKEGDFILSNSMSFGKPFIMKTTGYIHDGWFVLRLKSSIDINYFYYLLISPFVIDQFNDLASGAIVKNINSDLVKKVIIPIPPLPEQQRIVAILDEAFEAIARAKENTEKNLQNGRELIKSYRQSVFANPGDDWGEKKLGAVCDIINGGTPDTKEARFWGGNNLWITPKDMGKLDSLYVEDTERKLTDAGLKNSSAKILPIYSIILSSRAPIGHLAINKKEIATNQGCKGIIPKKELSVLFTYYFLLNSIQLLNDLGSGTTFKELSGSKLADVKIPLPPLPEQQRIVVKLDALSTETKKLAVKYQYKLAELEELKKAILEKAFKGELSGGES